MKVIDPDATVRPFDEEARERVAALARRQIRANGLLMQAINFAGGQVEDTLKLLPKGARDQIEGGVRRALTRSFDLASRSRTGLPGRISGERAHRVLGTISGALGGIGGLPTALAELPVATTLIFRAVLEVAEAHGEDAASEETRIECLRVFGAGGPGGADDGVDTSFIGARLALSGAAVNGLIARVAPKFAAVLSQKLAAQTVPVLGAAAGAGTNYAFVDYYVAMAHVHFGLRAAAREYGEDRVLDHFHKVLAERRVPVHRGRS